MTNLDADIAHRIKSKGKPEQAQKLSRIEETAARLAELKRQGNALETASYTASRLPKHRAKYCPEAHIKIASDAAYHEQCVIEEALSVTKPESLVDVLITLTVSLWRLDSIKFAATEDKENFETDRGIVENTLERAIPVLEKRTGVTLAELGLDSYFTPSKSPEELIADVAAMKEAYLRDLSTFTGAEPITDPAEYEFLKEKLRRIILAFKAIKDLKIDENDDGADGALCRSLEKVATAAEDEIADMQADSLAVAAAKLVFAQFCDMRHDLTVRNSNGGWHCDQQTAQAALKAIEWFGLKDLYDAYYPDEEECTS
jgi:hypothetical protein